MNLDGDHLSALGFGRAAEVSPDGWRVWRVDHRDRTPEPRLVSKAESQRRWRAKAGPTAADEAARKRAERAGWSAERREQEREAVRARRARKVVT